MINLGAAIFTNPKKMGRLLQDPEQPAQWKWKNNQNYNKWKKY